MKIDLEKETIDELTNIQEELIEDIYANDAETPAKVAFNIGRLFGVLHRIGVLAKEFESEK